VYIYVDETGMGFVNRGLLSEAALALEAEVGGLC
jgi:hypothetical protein